MNAAASLGDERNQVSASPAARLTFARVDSAHLPMPTAKTTPTRSTTTTPFDLASSTTPETWTLGRPSYEVARPTIELFRLGVCARDFPPEKL